MWRLFKPLKLRRKLVWKIPHPDRNSPMFYPHAYPVPHASQWCWCGLLVSWQWNLAEPDIHTASSLGTGTGGETAVKEAT